MQIALVIVLFFPKIEVSALNIMRFDYICIGNVQQLVTNIMDASAIGNHEFDAGYLNL